MTEQNLNVRIQTFDAELAQHYLDTYNNNNYRKIVDSQANHYANLMSKGEWMTSASTIAIDTNGNLVNGQHRLVGVVKSGVEVDLIVITGADPASVYAVDTHESRKMKDHCQCPAYLITSVNVLLRSVGLHNDKTYTKDVKFYKKHVDGLLGRFVTKMHKIHASTSDPFTSWGVRGALLVAVLNGEMTQTAALDLFSRLVKLRKVKVKGPSNAKRHMYASSTRMAVQSSLSPLMSTLVDYLDANHLPVWSGVNDTWRYEEYDVARDKAQKLMYAMGQCLSRYTKNDSKFAKPMQVNVRQALGL